MRRAIAFVLFGVALLAGSLAWLTHPAVAGIIVGVACVLFGLLSDWKPAGRVDRSDIR